MKYYVLIAATWLLAAIDAAFAGLEGKAQVIELEQFAPICDGRK